jgi:tRNA A-37 threonylcarbamoyl transferase component Bud32
MGSSERDLSLPLVAGQRLPHGYTNISWRHGDRIYKRYLGPDALTRLQVEVASIQAVAGTIPVPAVIDAAESDLIVVFAFVPGRHGQELIDDGQGAPVLRATGRMLRRFQAQHPRLVHGDYGPQNLLFESEHLDVVAVLDWEFAHQGDELEDLAWAEWIVRMHHPHAVVHLDALFDGYGRRPPWPDRLAAMLARCEVLRRQNAVADEQVAAAVWRTRAETTRRWHA